MGTEQRDPQAPKIEAESEGWVVLIFAAGWRSEEVAVRRAPWEDAWRRESPEAACSLAGLLVAGARTLGQSWRPVGAVTGATGRTLSGASMVGALTLIRGCECGMLPSVTDDPPGPFGVRWHDPMHIVHRQAPDGTSVEVMEHLEAEAEPAPGHEPMLVVVMTGAEGEEFASICVEWEDRFAEPGEEAYTCDAVKAICSRLAEHWRFGCAVSGRDGRILVTQASLGHLENIRGDVVHPE